ncbi:MAG: glycoside hydrolase family 32 protein [Eubacterium sp.]|nr:glycoside hydrolase family 32 protein [Candidatus Colimonas fimequi]
MSREIMQAAIDRAAEEINRNRAKVSEAPSRQKYHFMAETGWINDPNGLIYYKGKYHFFYQYYPYAGFWDCMHWGHAISDDMLHWEYLPLALAPSEWYDDHMKGGCFSGSAIVHDDMLFLMYTGTANNGNGFEQTQCIAYSQDGINFTKYEGNPVLTAPEGIPTDFFRDPYVWKHNDTYYAVIGANKNNMAQALLYKSPDMFNWEFVNVLHESRGEWGFMWECPTFFELDGKFVLAVSPMGAGERTSVYFVGDFDYETGKFFPQKTGETDWGFHYYAPTSFCDDKNRRIMVAWANCWDWMPFWKDWGPTYREGWCGTFNIPRVATLNEDLSLSFKPIEEIESIRSGEESLGAFTVADGETKNLKTGFCYEMKLTVDLKATDADSFSFLLRQSGDNKTVITYDLKNYEIRFDVNNADGWSKGVARGPLNIMGKDELDIDILSDRSSVEIFNDNYTTNLSCNVYTKVNDEVNAITACGGSVVIKEACSWNLEKTM